MGHRCQRRLFLTALAVGLLTACSAPHPLTTTEARGYVGALIPWW